jgi:hypothetical protein
MWNWYEWETLADFNAWHDAKKLELGLPKLSINASGQSIEPMIEEYTNPVEVDGKTIAMVEENHANDLLLTELRPIKVTSEYYEA